MIGTSDVRRSMYNSIINHLTHTSYTMCCNARRTNGGSIVVRPSLRSYTMYNGLDLLIPTEPRWSGHTEHESGHKASFPYYFMELLILVYVWFALKYHQSLKNSDDELTRWKNSSALSSSWSKWPETITFIIKENHISWMKTRNCISG